MIAGQKQFDNSVNLEMKSINTLEGHTLGVEAVQFRPGVPDQMMSASHDKIINVWDMNTLKVSKSTKLNTYLYF